MRLHSSSKSSEQGSVLLAVVFASLILTISAIAIMDWSYSTFKSTMRKATVENARIIAHNELEMMYLRWSNVVNEPSATTLETKFNSTELDPNGNPLCVADANVAAAASLRSPFVYQIPGRWGSAPAPTVLDGGGTTDVPELIADSDHPATYEPGPTSHQDTHATVAVARSLNESSLSAIGVYRVPSLDPARTVQQSASVRYFNAKVRVVVSDPSLKVDKDNPNDNSGTVEVRYGRRFVFQKVSPVQGAVFYHGNLELSPGSDMDIIGDVQSNSSVFIGSQVKGTDSDTHQVLHFNIRVAGNVYYYDQYNGNVDNTTGTQHRMFGLDSLGDPTFNRDLTKAADTDQSIPRADQVKKIDSRDFFVSTTKPEVIYDQYKNLNNTPYPTVNDVYRAVIAPPPAVAEDAEVASNRMYNKASFVITVGNNNTVTVKNRAGQDVTGKFGQSIAPVVRTSMTDKRETKDILVTNLDVGALKAAIEADDSLRSAYNGVVYVYDPGETDSGRTYGVRLVNASEVPNVNDQGFVVASDNGVYIQGSFNTRTVLTKDTDTQRAGEVSTKLEDTPHCAVMGDAITLLSSGWQDANASKPLYATDGDGGQNRVATASSTINAAIVSGNTPTTSAASGSGGVQNLVRYLENWSGLTSTVNGSLVQLYESNYFKSPYKGGVYVQPSTRVLAFDRRLAEKPPAGLPSSHKNYYRGDFFAW